jgi:hypothetical protein
LFVSDLLGLVFLKILVASTLKVSVSFFSLFKGMSLLEVFADKFAETNLFIFSKIFGHLSDQGFSVFVSSPKNIGLSTRKLG